LAEQNALQVKMEHLALMSRGLAHDLKNLLTPVSSFLVHTEGKYTPGSAAEEVHAAAQRSMRVMHDYVRDALAFSERLEIRPETLRPAEIFAGAIKVVEPRAAARKVSLEVGPCADFTLIADPVLVQRLLVNLLANAVDASAEGRTVTLAASLVRSGWCSLEVRDQGSGIPPEHLQQIFEPYFSTKQLGDTVRGFGLGLTISDKIARLHSGSIRVHSVVNEGTTMSFDLPLEPPPKADSKPPRPAPLIPV
jgi:signal transduction histidine kinase